MADIAIRWGLVALSRDQKKLFPHFGEAGTAVFAVEEVEYGGHNRTPSFDHHHAIMSLGVQYVIWITAPLNELGIPTARGLGKWSPEVARVRQRIDDACLVAVTSALE